MEIRLYKRKLNFKFAAGTSRGFYHDRDVYYVVMQNEESFGIGECSKLLKLSCDDVVDYEEILIKACKDFPLYDDKDEFFLKYKDYPSIVFGFETAFCHFTKNSLVLFDNAFTKGLKPIVINGLIWMGSYDLMKERLLEKISLGFKTIKIKIGAIDFAQELDLIKKIRSDFSAEDITIRVDANGAFDKSNVYQVLDELSKLQIHSIEQPVAKEQYALMHELCCSNIIPIALDEELISLNDIVQKDSMLDAIRPQYIILKPSLHGGIRGAQEWILLAKKYGISYWLTSALESNVGLNAIAQFASSLDITLPQGLGTGLLYHNNIEYPLYLKGEQLYFNPDFKVSFKEYLQSSQRLL